MKLRIYHVDAFVEARPFSGNPAAVVPLDDWLDDATLLGIARENNLSETAYIVRGGADGADWQLRWFTPGTEVALCGHATLGAAHAIREFIDPAATECRFATRQAGVLAVAVTADGYEMRFPAVASAEVTPPQGLADALGAVPHRVLVGSYSPDERDYVAVLATEAQLRDLAPDMGALARLDSRGLICTAPGEAVDFVSRYFAPGAGVNEDPVTGSAHCILTPYWACELGKEDLTARQISPRGGALGCVVDGDIVRLSGRAVTYLEGTITI